MSINELLLTSAKNNQLAHSYLFYGPDQNQTLTSAQQLASILENNQKVLIDCKIIEAVLDSIGINQVREINNFLWRKPILSLRRTLIIKNAGSLTAQAQNALLKITEEPPPHGFIILIVNKLEELLPTLLSRFQKHYFPAINQSVVFGEAQKFIKASKIEKKNIIKNLLEDEGDLGEFVKSVMGELDHDPIKNFRPLKAMLTYWSNISQYNTNKKLQLEAWIESFPS